MKRCLIVFAKEPKIGRVKTRLSRCLSHARCLELYKVFLKDVMGLTKRVDCEDKVIAFDANMGSPRFLKSVAPQSVFYKQSGRNLGERMHNALKFARLKGASSTVIIGSDSPTLPARFIKDAFCRLTRNDVVIGPSRDGGYYLIGLKRPCYGIFKDIKWSSDKVFKDTVRNCKRLKKKLAVLDGWYDVDDPQSFSYLKQDLSKKRDRSIARWTRKLLKL